MAAMKIQLKSLLFFFLCTLVVLWWPAGAAAGDISPDLQAVLVQSGANDAVPVIIHLNQKFDRRSFNTRNRFFHKAVKRSRLIRQLRDHAALAQKNLIGLFNRQNSQRLKPLWIINGIAARLRARTIPVIARHPAVERIQLDRIVPLAVEQPLDLSPPEWNINAIQADALWSLGFRGQGVVVGVMDSGVDLNHPDLAASYRGGTNSWFDPNGEYASPTDNDGHGTAVSSVVAGDDADGSFIGVAPDALWVAVKIFNSQGHAPLSAVHAGFQWMLDPDGDPATDDAPDIVNNSWGFEYAPGTCDLEFSEDIALLKTAGIAVVFSAGNSGPYDQSSIAPANDPLAAAAGAVDSTLSIADFSARGPSACDGGVYPNLVAPGVSIKTADLTFGGIFPDSYLYRSGTSFAAPHIAGAMALLLSAYPDLTPIELEQALVQSAVDLGPVGPDTIFGHGMVDVLAAYHYLDAGGACTDSDGDGFFGQSNCGSEPDCNDGNAAVYPGAAEIPRDGIDQDCNGYDLSIDVTYATYDALDDSLVVHAYSAMDQDAGLAVDIPGIGIKTMVWKTAQGRWQRGIGDAGLKGLDIQNPGSVTVSGVEGAVHQQILVLGPQSSGQNGSIDITHAIYAPASDTIVIHARTDLGADANLVVDIPGVGIRAMVWNAAMNQWQRGLADASQKGLNPVNPGSVTVTGIEGQQSHLIDIASE
jgi:serine protease AprX